MKYLSSPEIILITGPKHSGKTAAGLSLAELLDAEFVDLDQLVEAQTGKSTRSLFREGPDVFRRAETQALASLIPGAAAESSPGQSGAAIRVVAAGGGLADNAGAVDLLQQFARKGAARVYLEVSADTAWERIHRGAMESGEGPAFLDVENPRETNAALHIRRGAAYREMATLTVDGEGRTPQAIAGEIALRLAPASPLPEDLRPKPPLRRHSKEAVYD
jgi:shikimate kinase